MRRSSWRKTVAVRRKYQASRRLRPSGSSIARRLAHSPVLVCNGMTPIRLLDT